MKRKTGRGAGPGHGALPFPLLCLAVTGLILLCLLPSACTGGRGAGDTGTGDAGIETAGQTNAPSDPGAESRSDGTEPEPETAEVLTLSEADETAGPHEDEPAPGNRLGCVPVLYVTTEDGASIRSDTRGVRFTLDVKMNGETARTGMTGEIKLRGNASLGWDKKSYTLTFDEKQAPVGAGCGKGRGWVLISNHCDKSLLRNYAAFWLQEQLDGIAWSPWACMADVYVNGSYCGSYLLAEKVTCGNGRLDVDNVTGGVDADCLLELDNYASKSGEKGVTWFTARAIPYQIRGEETHSSARCDAVDARMTKVYDIICSGTRAQIDRVLDVPSAVDAYIAAEVTKNIDCGWSSFFLYFKDGKLHLGPLWDFDLAMGNDMRLDNGSWRGIYAGKDRGFSQGNVWFIELMKKDWFRALVAARWQELTENGVFTALLDELAATEDVCHASFERNFRKWPVLRERINQEPDALLTQSKASSSAQVGYLLDWLEKRVDWLDGNGF